MLMDLRADQPVVDLLYGALGLRGHGWELSAARTFSAAGARVLAPGREYQGVASAGTRTGGARCAAARPEGEQL